jgi:hypothetical protein
VLAEILPRVRWVVEFLPESGRPQSHYFATSNSIDRKIERSLEAAVHLLSHRNPEAEFFLSVFDDCPEIASDPHYKPITYFYCRPLPFAKAQSR